jgi:hypothetical protein
MQTVQTAFYAADTATFKPSVSTAIEAADGPAHKTTVQTAFYATVTAAILPALETAC